MTRRDGTRTLGTVLGTALGTALLATGLAPTTLDAQQTDGRWLAWTGCWQPVSERSVDDAPMRARPANDAAGAYEAGTGEQEAATLVCFQPLVGEDGVEKITVRGSEVVSRETVRADGVRRETSAEGCTGWERGEFASRPGRVYVTSEHVCEGDVTRTSSGILALVSTGSWVDIQVVSTGGQSGAWITRYELASPPAAEAAGFGTLGAERVMAIRTARVAASADPTVDDVIEATGAVDGEAVQAWLLERDAALDLDADALVRLADAGVPENVIDMAIAVTHPEQFAVEAEEPARYGDRYGYDYSRPWGYWDPFYGSMFWSPFGFYRPFGFYSRYGYGYGYGSGFGYPYGRGYFGGVRVVPVRGGGDSGGRVISGEGYRRGSGASPRRGDATPRGGAVRAPTGRSAQPRSSGSSGSSSGRTAKKRGGGGGGNGGSGGGGN